MRDSICSYKPKDRPIENYAHGVTFVAQADLVGGVEARYTLYGPDDTPEAAMPPAAFGAAVADFIGWHAMCIWETLNGFSGYGNVWFKLIPVPCDEKEEVSDV